MNKKLTLAGLTFVLVLVGIFVYTNYQNNEFQRETGINPQTIVPQFVDDREYENVPLPEDLKRIKNGVESLLISKKHWTENDRFNDVTFSLRGVGKGFAIFRINYPRGGDRPDSLLNLKTGEAFPLGGTATSVIVGDTFLYVENDKINSYTFGQKNLEMLPNSQLNSSETYMSTLGSMIDAPRVISTVNNMVTLSVYSVQNMVWNPITGDYVGQQKLRDITFTIK